MKTCVQCIINDNYPGLTFNDQGVCSLCHKQQHFVPIGEEHLIRECETAKETARKRNIEFDVLVPLSGGKDSTYMLYLATKKYKLRTLAMTFDNGLLSDLALRNIRTTVKNSGAKHVFFRPDPELLKQIYRTMFRSTGDICGTCDIGTTTSILKTSHDYNIPLIFSGVSPLEDDSFVPDSVQDVTRFKYIMKKEGTVSKKELNKFLIYPNMNFFTQSFYKRTGYFGKLLYPLYYIENPMDKEMGGIIERELGWEDSVTSEYTKHFDCIAEPFTNYIRNRIYGYERRVCQYSNMIRRGEIKRDQALRMLESDNLSQMPANTGKVMEYLDVTEAGLNSIIAIEPLKYEKHTSRMNRLFATLKRVKDKV